MMGWVTPSTNDCVIVGAPHWLVRRLGAGPARTVDFGHRRRDRGIGHGCRRGHDYARDRDRHARGHGASGASRDGPFPGDDRRAGFDRSTSNRFGAARRSGPGPVRHRPAVAWRDRRASAYPQGRWIGHDRRNPPSGSGRSANNGACAYRQHRRRGSLHRWRADQWSRIAFCPAYRGDRPWRASDTWPMYACPQC